MSQRAFTVITLSVTFARSMGTPLVIATFHTRSRAMKPKPFTTMGQKMMNSVQCEMTVDLLDYFEYISEAYN